LTKLKGAYIGGDKSMNKKLIGISICILLIVTIIAPVAMSVNVCRSYTVLQGTIDQSQEERDSDEDVNQYAWQEFVPTGENLLSVEVKIRLGFLWPPDLFLSIEKPLGTVLTSTSLPSQSIPWERSEWVTFDFHDILLVRGDKYYIVLSHESGGTYKWSGAWGDLYSQGESSKNPQWDWCFRTIVDKSKEKHCIGAEHKWTDLFLVTMNENKQIIYNNPPNPPEITGPLFGKVEKSYVYYFTVTDPDEYDGLWELEIDFGDEIVIEKSCDSGECVPWDNGETVEIKHMWKITGTYEITARVMDVYGEWSEWSDPLSVSMPKNKAINSPFLRFLEQHPHMFPLLQQLLELK
jgi:hypothetical protein